MKSSLGDSRHFFFPHWSPLVNDAGHSVFTFKQKFTKGFFFSMKRRQFRNSWVLVRTLNISASQALVLYCSNRTLSSLLFLYIVRTQLQDILKGWRIFKLTAVALRPKSSQSFVFKAFKNSYSRSDRLTEVFFFFILRLVIFRR